MTTRFYLGNGGDNSDFEKKLALLDKSDFKYNFDREIFINQKSLTIVSIEYIQDNSIETIERTVFSQNIKNSPRLFLSNQGKKSIPPLVRSELIASIFPRYRP